MRRRSIQVTQGERSPLAPLVSTELGLSPAEAEALVRRGAVYVDGRRCLDPARSLAGARAVTVVLEEAGRSALTGSAETPALTVLYEDEWLVAVDKPPGITAQPTAGRVGESLVDRVGERLGRPAGLVHRLDRETSGVTVFGKTAEATAALAAQFREGSARKRYLAATGPGLPGRAVIDLPLSRDPSRIGRYRATAQAHGVSAMTELQRLFASDAYCLVALFPKTGRTHQLRAHLAALGAPILGDRLYGGAPRAGGREAPRCLLHAQALLLCHPRSGESLLLEAPVPEDLAAFFRNAGTAPPRGGF